MSYSQRTNKLEGTYVIYTYTFPVYNSVSCASAARNRCPLPPRAGRHMVGHRAGVHLGSVATYVCDMDYQFPGGGSHRTVVCRDDGTWSDAVGHCQRTWGRWYFFQCVMLALSLPFSLLTASALALALALSLPISY